MPFYLIWQHNDEVLRGRGSDWIDGHLTFPVVFPGRYSLTQRISLRSSARDSNTLETLKNVKLFLEGDADHLEVVQKQWPVISADRPELNGGFEISFDGGRSYTRFSETAGLLEDSGTWITLPAAAIGLNGQAGVLGPFDQAHFLVRYKVPPGATLFGVLDVRLAADFDVV